LQNGVLAPVIEDYASFERGIYAVLTARGRGHPLAQQFMDCLAHEVQMTAGSLLQAKKKQGRMTLLLNALALNKLCRRIGKFR
jgi:hypothetical protein